MPEQRLLYSMALISLVLHGLGFGFLARALSDMPVQPKADKVLMADLAMSPQPAAARQSKTETARQLAQTTVATPLQPPVQAQQKQQMRPDEPQKTAQSHNSHTANVKPKPENVISQSAAEVSPPHTRHASADTRNNSSQAVSAPHQAVQPQPQGLSSARKSAENSEPLQLGADRAPAFVKRVAPVYPALARRQGREGVVVLRLVISSTGELQDVEPVQEAGSGFTEAAMEAVRKSSYMPAKRNGMSVTSKALVTIRFTLR